MDFLRVSFFNVIVLVTLQSVPLFYCKWKKKNKKNRKETNKLSTIFYSLDLSFRQSHLLLFPGETRKRIGVRIRVRTWIRVRIRIKPLPATVNLRLTPFVLLLGIWPTVRPRPPFPKSSVTISLQEQPIAWLRLFATFCKLMLFIFSRCETRLLFHMTVNRASCAYELL